MIAINLFLLIIVIIVAYILIMSVKNSKINGGSEKGLNPGVYAVMDPVHLENEKIDKALGKIGKKGKLIEFDGYTLFGFQTRYGAGTLPMKIGDKSVGTVDSDYGTLVVVPLDLIKKLDNPYTIWFVGSTQGIFANAFQIEKIYFPKIEKWVFKLDDIEIDTNDPQFNSEEEKEKILKRLKPGQALSRNLSAYITMHLEFTGSKK